MKETGIVRRVDDLGRVVIPKEIRKSINIDEGEPLEIYVDYENGSVIFRKYENISYTNNIENLKKKIFEDDETTSNLTDEEIIILEYHFDNISRMLKGE